MQTQIGETLLTWAVCEDGVIEGLSEVTVAGVRLCDPSFPSRFIFQGPDGWDYRTFRHRETVTEGTATVIRTEAIGTAADTSWFRDQYDHDILYLGRPRQAPPLEVDFVLTPVAERYGGATFAGFTLSWRFRCTGGKLGRLRWQQHWEVGGSTDENTVYWQSQIASPVKRFTHAETWDTFCWKTLRRAKCDENISMQMNSRVAYHQLFDMLSAPQGTLIAYFATAASVQTASRKNTDEDNYHLFESLEFPLCEHREIVGKTVLFSCEADQTEAARRNLWFDVNRALEESYRSQTGIAKSRTLPTMTHDMWGAFTADNRLFYDPRGSGERVPAERYLEWLGENEMPRARAQGYRRFWTRPYCMSDASELMFWNKSMQGKSVMDGDVTIGSCCCVQAYKPSAMYGGGAMAKRFYELGRAQGLEVGIWVGNHLSTRAPVLREHPEWVLKDRNFANPAGGYDDLIMAVVNWNSPAREWILKDLVAWKRDYGLDFIFFDSLGNLGLKTRNYAADDLADNFDGLVRFVAEVRQAGIEVICEGRSFLGAPHFGISNDGNMESTADPLRGQNSLGWYLGNEDMFCGMEAFTNHNPRVPAERLIDMHFRIMAGGGLLDVHGGPPALADHFHLYNRVCDDMVCRTVLEDGAGVRWDAPRGGSVLFTFKAGRVALPAPGRIRQVLADGLHDIGMGATVDAAAKAVYLIEP